MLWILRYVLFVIIDVLRPFNQYGYIRAKYNMMLRWRACVERASPTDFSLYKINTIKIIIIIIIIIIISPVSTVPHDYALYKINTITSIIIIIIIIIIVIIIIIIIIMIIIKCYRQRIIQPAMWYSTTWL